MYSALIKDINARFYLLSPLLHFQSPVMSPPEDDLVLIMTKIDLV